MIEILTFKENLKKLYKDYSMYIDPLTRFVVMVVSILILNSYVGQDGIINNPFVAIIISAVCCLLPINVGVFVHSCLVVVNVLSVNVIMALIVAMIYMIMLICYFRFAPKYGYIMLLTVILFAIKIPYLMPIVVGLAATPSAVVAMVFGIIVYYILNFAGTEAIKLENGSTVSDMDKVNTFLDNLLNNNEFMMIMAAFIITAVIAYLIRRTSMDHSHRIAIIAAGAFEMAFIICGALLLNTDMSQRILLTGILILVSMGVAVILDVFILSVDYQRTEYTQFEDDDYYYYVKAVPKIKLQASDVQVKHINVNKKRNRRR